MAKLKFNDNKETETTDAFDLGFSDAPAEKQKTYELGTIVEIPINLIEIGENIRNVMTDDEERLRQLGESIKKDGQIEPCIVYQEGDKYIIKAGSRRFKACSLCDVKTLKCIIEKKFEDEKSRIIYQATENEHRTDMNSREREKYMKRLLELGMKEIDIAKALHKGRSWVNVAITAGKAIDEDEKLKTLAGETASTRDTYEYTRLTEEEKNEVQNDVENSDNKEKAFKDSIKKHRKAKLDKNKKKKEEENKSDNNIDTKPSENTSDKPDDLNIDSNFSSNVGGIEFEMDNSADESEIETDFDSDISSEDEISDETSSVENIELTIIFTKNNEKNKIENVNISGRDFENIELTDYLRDQIKNYYYCKGFQTE